MITGYVRTWETERTDRGQSRNETCFLGRKEKFKTYLEGGSEARADRIRKLEGGGERNQHFPSENKGNPFDAGYLKVWKGVLEMIISLT